MSLGTLPTRNFDALIALILHRFFDNSAEAHRWSAIARVCRRWSEIVARFDITSLVPRQLYYNAAAIARHNIAPSFDVWCMIPQNAFPPKRNTHEHCIGIPRRLFVRLGWPSGEEAVLALTRRWGPHPGWKQIIAIWQVNGTINVMRIATMYDVIFDTKWNTCVSLRASGFTDVQSFSEKQLYDHRTLCRNVMIYSKVALPQNGAMRFPCQAHLVTLALKDGGITNESLLSVLDALTPQSFNLAMVYAINRATMSRQTNLLDMLAQSNDNHPRYEPVHFVPQRDDVDIAERLASMKPGPRNHVSEFHPYDIHIPAYCDNCRNIASAR